MANNNLSIFAISKTYFSLQNAIGDFRPPINSFRLSQWTLRHSTLSGTPKFVAASIAPYWNTDSQLAHPNLEQIAASAGLSSATVKRSMIKIKASGEWLIFPGHRRYGPGGPLANTYYPLAPKPEDEKIRIPKHPNVYRWKESWLRKKLISEIPIEEYKDKPSDEQIAEAYDLYIKSLDISLYVKE